MALGLSPESSLFLGIDLFVALAPLTHLIEHLELAHATALGCANMAQEENNRE